MQRLKGLTSAMVQFPISLEKKILSDFPGPNRDTDFWAFLESDGRRIDAIKRKCESFGVATPWTSIDLSVPVLEWLKARVFKQVTPHYFFDQQLEWFFHESECLLVRQLYAVMNEHGAGSRRQWAIFTWLIDIWAGAPDLDGSTCARYFWNKFCDHILSSADKDRLPIDELIGEAARTALDAVNTFIPLCSCSTPWSIQPPNFVQFLQVVISGNPLSTPMIERVVYGAAMFHPGTALAGSGRVPIPELGSFFSFLKALPRATFTRHLPAVSALSAKLRRTFATQLSLGYALLRLCPTCADLLALNVEDPDPRDKSGNPAPLFRTLWLPDLTPDHLQEFKSAFEAIDLCCAPWETELRLTDAYARLCAFTRVAVNTHNALLLVAQPKTVPFSVLERSHVCPHINVENTLVQVLARELAGVVDFRTSDPLAIVQLLFERLTAPTSCWFGSHEDDFPSKILFGFEGEETDILGFTDAIFRDSLGRFLAARDPAVRAAAVDRELNTGNTTVRDAGLAAALVLFQDVGEGRDVKEQLSPQFQLAATLTAIVAGRTSQKQRGKEGTLRKLEKRLRDLCSKTTVANLQRFIELCDNLWSPSIVEAVQRLWS
jgi:hypothetical protein